MTEVCLVLINMKTMLPLKEEWLVCSSYNLLLDITILQTYCCFRLVQGLIDLDTHTDAEHERFGLSVFQDYLQETQTVVQDLLLDICLGNSCTVCPFTDAYTYTTAYLLLWDVVFQMCGLASSELRSQYATHIRYLSCCTSTFSYLSTELFDTSVKKRNITYHKTYLYKSTVNCMHYAVSFLFSFPNILAKILMWNMFEVNTI
jgi:hypothetical protein